MDAKIYDYFCYFSEDMLLKQRLETLWDYIGYFFIASNKTISGMVRSVNFNHGKVKKYQEKSRYSLAQDHPLKINDIKKITHPMDHSTIKTPTVSSSLILKKSLAPNQ